MFTPNGQSGFTIIETILFLAISSAMVVVAMVSIQGRTQQVQFDDSIRSLESFLETRLAQVDNGSVDRPDASCQYNGVSLTTSASNGSCVFLGYMLRFDPSGSDVPQTDIEVYQIYGARLSSAEISACDPGETFACVVPTAIPSTPVETFTVPWSVELVQAQTDSNNIAYVGFLREPDSTFLRPISLAGSLTSEFQNATPTIYEESYPLSWIGSEFNAKLCYTDTVRVASINFGLDGSELAIDTEFNDTACPTP